LTESNAGPQAAQRDQVAPMHLQLAQCHVADDKPPKAPNAFCDCIAGSAISR
jgi:hypothetical protein